MLHFCGKKGEERKEVQELCYLGSQACLPAAVIYERGGSPCMCWLGWVWCVQSQRSGV